MVNSIKQATHRHLCGGEGLIKQMLDYQYQLRDLSY